jgi:hypothetical protein
MGDGVRQDVLCSTERACSAGRIGLLHDVKADPTHEFESMFGDFALHESDN